MDKAIERGVNPNAKEGELILRRYDAMIPAGSSGKVAVILEALTENRNRTAANVRHMVTKVGGELLPTGSNDWLFEHTGLIWVPKEIECSENEANGSDESEVKRIEVDSEKLLECALEAGATDVDLSDDGNDSSNGSDEDSHIVIKCEPQNLLSIVKILRQDGFATKQFENQWLLKDEDNKVTVDEEGVPLFEKFLDAIEEDLDVVNVFHNAESINDL